MSKATRGPSMTQIDLLNDYARTRDADAFAKIVAQYERLILATCRRGVRPPPDADDAAQGTIFRLAQKSGSVRSNLGAWLHGCAVNVARDINRRRLTRQRHETAAARSDVDGPPRELAELREQLDIALVKLDSQQRELIIARFFSGRTQVELAAEAGLSPSTLSERLDHAIVRLRRHLASPPAIPAIAALLEAEHATAIAPAHLTANIMAIGLSGVPRAGTVAAAASVLPLTIKLIAGLAAVVAIALAVRAASPTRQIVPMAATAPAQPSDILMTTFAASTAPAASPPQWQTTQPVAGNAVLSGRVLDRDNNPIAGATVQIAGPG